MADSAGQQPFRVVAFQDNGNFLVTGIDSEKYFSVRKSKFQTNFSEGKADFRCNFEPCWRAIRSMITLQQHYNIFHSWLNHCSEPWSHKRKLSFDMSTSAWREIRPPYPSHAIKMYNRFFSVKDCGGPVTNQTKPDTTLIWGRNFIVHKVNPKW